MPVYEYYCEHCHGVFEQLLPVRRASEAQPCPECDGESRRLMPTTVNSFVVRHGIPRRIPDTGKFWHHEQVVDRPVNTTVEMGEHPDLYYQKFGPERPPTVEEEEQFADQMVQHLQQRQEIEESGGLVPNNQYEQHLASQFLERKAKTAPQAKAARLKNPNSKVTPRTVTGKHVSSKASTKPKRGGKAT